MKNSENISDKIENNVEKPKRIGKANHRQKVTLSFSASRKTTRIPNWW